MKCSNKTYKLLHPHSTRHYFCWTLQDEKIGEGLENQNVSFAIKKQRFEFLYFYLFSLKLTFFKVNMEFRDNFFGSGLLLSTQLQVWVLSQRWTITYFPSLTSIYCLVVCDGGKYFIVKRQV